MTATIAYRMSAEPSTLAEVAARPKLERKLRAYDYDDLCDVCREWVVGPARQKCVSSRLNATLCAACLAALPAAREALKVAADGSECAHCGARYRYVPTVSLRHHCSYRCRDLAKAAKEAAAKEAAKRARVKYMGPERKGYVYRLYSASGSLLYIGKTYRVVVRMFGPEGHARTKEWWRLVKSAEVAVYSTEADALDAEAHAIATERPRYNRVQPTALGPAPAPLARYRGEFYAD